MGQRIIQGMPLGIKKPRKNCYITSDLTITNRKYLMSDNEFMTFERVKSECDCEKSSSCIRIMVLLERLMPTEAEKELVQIYHG